MFHTVWLRLRKVHSKIIQTRLVNHIRRVQRETTFRDVIKKILSCIFSHFGLFLLLLLYTFFGAWMFQLCEYDKLYQSNVNTNSKTTDIDNLRQKLSDFLKNMAQIGPGNMNITKATIKQMLDDYHSALADAIQNAGYSGSPIGNPGSKWNFASAVLFALSIVTMIGYGHVTPTTEFGRFLVIPYALLGIPLLLIFLTDHGFAIGALLRNCYVRLCCFGFRNTREKNIEAVRLAHHKQFMGGKLLYVEELKQAPKTKHPIHGDDGHVPVTLLFFLVTLYVLFGTIMFWQTENWSFVNSVYFCIVTLFTIGFGDFVPNYLNIDTAAATARLIIACLYMVVGLALLTMSITLIVDELFNSAKKMAAKIAFLKECEELEDVDVL